MALMERLNQRLADIDSAILRLEKSTAEQTAALRAQKAALLDAAKLLTPAIEAAFAGLQKIGVFPNAL